MITVILGVFALAYGLFTLYLRIFKQSKGLGDSLRSSTS